MTMGRFRTLSLLVHCAIILASSLTRKREGVAMSLQIIWNDITKVRADAVVTPASRKPRIGRGLDGVIHKAAGAELLDRRREMGPIGPGVVHVSPSYGLERTTGAKYVIHALGPIWNKSRPSTIKPALDDTYLRVLLKARAIGCKVVSVPVMSSGKFGMPMGRAVDAAVSAINAFLEAVPDMTVKLVGIDSDFHAHVLRNYSEWYVETGYTTDEERVYRRGNSRDRADGEFKGLGIDEENDYFNEMAFGEIMDGTTFKEAFKALWNRVDAASGKGGVSGSLRRRAVRLALETGISERTIKHYATPQSGSETTGKDKILAICVALRLPIEYAEALLKKCSHAFTPGDQRDAYIKAYVEARRGDVYKLNMELAKNNFKPLDTRHGARSGVSKSKRRRRRVKSAIG